uniref:Uncharacterized protein n=1 Tax=Daphnia galeata TaxID=27404 RepID=A0A8J2RQV2_9CRUS|nr:unnamed protein product [Daphnia galeata]
MATTCGMISLILVTFPTLYIVVTICSLLVVLAHQENELPTDFRKRHPSSSCSKYLFPLVWSNIMLNAPGCGIKKKFYDPIRELHNEIDFIGKDKDPVSTVTHPTTPAKESEDSNSIAPFVANILSGHSGPLCPQCPLIPVIPECPYIPPCPVCPTPVCPAIPPFPVIPSCPAPVIKSFPKLKNLLKNRNLKSKFIGRHRTVSPPPSEGVIFITNTNGCTTKANSFDVNLAPCTRGSGAPTGTIDVTFTAPGTSVIIGIAAVSPDTPINLTCTSFPSSFFGVTASLFPTFSICLNGYC